MKTFLFAAAAGILLSGCVTLGPTKRMQAYAGPALPDNRVATLRLHDTHANPANMLEKLWNAGIVAIDGVPTAGFGSAQVLPGRHRLTMYCWSRNIDVRRAEKEEVEVDLRAGKTYYPWAAIIATLISGSGVPGPVPDTFIGKLVDGFCKPHVADRMADGVR